MPLTQLRFELFHEPVTTAYMRRLRCQEDSEQLFCLGSVVAIAFKFRDDFALPRNVTFAEGLVSRALPVQTASRNCMRDEGRPFGFGNQVLIPSHRKLLQSKAMVVSVAETPGQ